VAGSASAGDLSVEEAPYIRSTLDKIVGVGGLARSNM